MASFIERYEKLNPKQKEAVDTIYGPVLVIAGPGSGKTELLSMRVANMLRLTDASPSNILCLTFTEKASGNMRERLASIIGQEAYRVNIHTFHSFGSEILNRYRYRISNAEELIPLDEIEMSNIFSHLQGELPWDDPWKRGSTWRDIRTAIDALKKAGITPSEYASLVEENKKICTLIAPEIEAKMEMIFSLGQKKEEKAEKIRLFSEFCTNMVGLLHIFPEKQGLIENFSTIFLRDLEKVQNSFENEYDTKPVTAWKNAWLEKDAKDNFVLKESGRIRKYESLVHIYEQYEAILAEKGFIDFSDMILQSIRLIEQYPDIRANLAEQYQWIMIDEYQDTNDAQLRLITGILSVEDEHPNIFAVGDDDQSIFKFQGANTKNIREFHDRWHNTQLILLDTNYRSFQEIIEASRTLMVGSLYDLGEIFPNTTKSFFSARGAGGVLRYEKFASEGEEISWIVRDIQAKIHTGVSPNAIAIITKKNGMLERVGKMLLAEKIPVALSKDISIFDTESVRLLVDMLQYIASLTTFQNDELLIRILSHPMWKIHRLVLWNLARDIHHARKAEKKNWIETLANHTDSKIRQIAHFFIEISLRAETLRLEECIDILSGADGLVIPSDYDENPMIQQAQIFSENISFASPFYAYFFPSTEDPSILLYHLESIRTLVEQVRAFRKRKGNVTITDFTEFLRLVEQYNIAITVHQTLGNPETSVNLITAHKSKGLEFAHVYAIGLTEGQYKRGKNTANVLPKNLPLLPEADDDEDIRRLVYTVWTRAEDTLTITYASANIDGKADAPVSVLTPFAECFETEVISENEMISVLQEEHHDIFLGPYEHEEQDFLRDRIEKQFVMNVSALQNFLDVSSGGPSHFLANTILRFPQAKSLFATYGSAMHLALEDFFGELKRSGKHEEDILFSSFSMAMEREGFPETQEYLDMIARGKEKITRLFPEISERTYGEIMTEFDFRTVGGGVFLDDIRLTGKIDRVEIIGDGRIRVTDYKTGSGFRDFSDSGTPYEKIKKWKYKLQLVFYALLFSLSPRFSAFPIREFELFFIEYDEKLGEFITIREYIQEGEIERLKALIRTVMQKIQNLDFPDISGYSPDIKGIRAFEEDLLEGRV